ncbi:MAG: hypothetical protein K2O84_08090 [Oscillospiraceae bacterium]|nr:hypothetical protein [Oscillospiraceae bacterium]
MGLHPQNIGISMPHGYAGGYARQPDMIVNTRPAGAQIVFGTALKYDEGKNVVPMGEGDGAAAFVGVAAREIKSALHYLDQSTGMYAEKEAVPVFMRGAVNVLCQKGTPQLGGAVYVRVAENASYPTAAAGGFEAEADGSSTVQLTNCQWAGPADVNKVTELRILTMQNA